MTCVHFASNIQVVKEQYDNKPGAELIEAVMFSFSSGQRLRANVDLTELQGWKASILKQEVKFVL